MYISIFIFAIALGIGCYSIIATIIKLPTFANAKLVKNRMTTFKTKKDIFDFIYVFSKPLSKYLPMSVPSEIRFERLLAYSETKQTPQEYQAYLVVYFLVVMAVTIPLWFSSLWFALAGAAAASYAVYNKHKRLKLLAAKTQAKIEDDLPQLIETVAHSLRTNRDIIQILSRYVANYDNFLSIELKRTIADMNTGNQVLALQRLEARLNNMLLSQLVRGIIATLHGEDMTSFFNELVIKVSAWRRQRYISIAKSIVPKIQALSMCRAFICIAVLLVVGGIGLYQMILSGWSV